jgi:hypothetical protein
MARMPPSAGFGPKLNLSQVENLFEKFFRNGVATIQFAFHESSRLDQRAIDFLDVYFPLAEANCEDICPWTKLLNTKDLRVC